MILLSMFFMHVYDDFCLQGILADMKQKQWWRKHPQYDDMYRNDYIVALIAHAFGWSFAIMLPLAIAIQFKLTTVFYICFIANVVLHAVIDDLKANKYVLNLWMDQLLHVLQILITAVVFELTGVINA